MQQSLLQPIADPTALFPTSQELRAPSALRNRAVPLAEVDRDAAVAASIHADAVPISERFCGALGLSAILAFGSGPMLAHAANINSHILMLFGLCSIVAAIAIQISERRRVIILLTQAALARGLDPTTARAQARATLKLWLS